MVLMSLSLDVLWFQLMVLVSLSLGYAVVSADGVNGSVFGIRCGFS